MKIFLPFYAIIFLTLLLACSETGLQPGNFAPNFSHKNLEGQEMKLSDLQGKVVVLNFWATWCAPCIEEMPSLQKLYQSLMEKGVVVLAVASRDSEAAVHKLKHSQNLTFPILIDTLGKSADIYKTTGFPETFIIDGNGRLVMVQDPQYLEPVTRLVGPRNWMSDTIIKELTHLAQETARG